MFFKREEKKSKEGRQADRQLKKEAAKDANDEALERLKEALDKFGPMKDLSDLLGKG